MYILLFIILHTRNTSTWIWMETDVAADLVPFGSSPHHTCLISFITTLFDIETRNKKMSMISNEFQTYLKFKADFSCVHTAFLVFTRSCVLVYSTFLYYYWVLHARGWKKSKIAIKTDMYYHYAWFIWLFDSQWKLQLATRSNNNILI